MMSSSSSVNNSSVNLKLLSVKKIILLKYNLEKKNVNFRKSSRISKPPRYFHNEFNY